MQGFNSSAHFPKTSPPLYFNGTSPNPKLALKFPQNYRLCRSSNRNLPMLKLLSSTAATSCRTHALTATTFRTAAEPAPFFKALSQLTGLTTRRGRTVGYRRFFCSDSAGKGDEEGTVVEAEAKSESDGSDTKSSSAIVSTNPRLEDYLSVRLKKFWFND